MATLLAVRGVTKRYPGVVALENVDLDLDAGEVHCLVGENGAGKSTVVKVLSGALQPDAGSIAIGGAVARLPSPDAAQRLGIGIIHQDFKLVPELSVAENILLGHEVTGGVFRTLDTRAMHVLARRALSQLEEEIDTGTRVSSLSVAQRQIVEIAKALSRNARIVAMDEPTASLTDREIRNLFRVIGRLKSEGVGILYISHRMEEIFDIGDRVTVLRDGKVVNTCAVAGVDRRTLVQWMVGRDIESEYPEARLRRGDELLRIEHLNTDRLHDIDLTLYAGEILGIGGLVGAGRSELAHTLFGASPKTGGTVRLAGKVIAPRSPHEAIQQGIALLTEDRNQMGLLLQLNIRENITLSSLDDFTAGPFIDRQREEAAAGEYVDELRIRPPMLEAEVETLSGGNRQKVVLARWLNTRARVLIFDEPTVGIDVGAKHEIYTIINRLAGEGVGVIVIASDLSELLGISSRIVVMCEGRIAGTLDRREATQEKIMMLATNTAPMDERQ